MKEEMGRRRRRQAGTFPLGPRRGARLTWEVAHIYTASPHHHSGLSFSNFSVVTIRGYISL